MRRDTLAPVRRLQIVKPREIIQHLRRRQVIVEIGLLGQIPDVAVHLNIGDGLPQNARRPGRPEKSARQGALMVVDFPAPFGPRNPNTSPFLDLHGQAFQRPFFLKVQEPERVVLGQIFNFNRCAWHALILRKRGPVVNQSRPAMCAERN